MKFVLGDRSEVSPCATGGGVGPERNRFEVDSCHLTSLDALFQSCGGIRALVAEQWARGNSSPNAISAVASTTVSAAHATTTAVSASSIITAVSAAPAAAGRPAQSVTCSSVRPEPMPRGAADGRRRCRC